MSADRKNKRPRIGISADVEPQTVRGVQISFAQLSEWYWSAITRAGGLPLLLPPLSAALAGEVLDTLDGLVLSGGDFDIDPALYGEAPHEKLGRLEPSRTHFELALLAEASARTLPVLGVCGGMQAMNVFRGGSLIQDLPSEPSAGVSIAHSQVGDKREAGHSVTLEPGGLLARLLGPEPLPVNSTHHQGLRRLGRDLRVEATATDGLVEAFSDAKARFFVGVQWHPEAMRDAPRHDKIYAALVTSAAERARVV